VTYSTPTAVKYKFQLFFQRKSEGSQTDSSPRRYTDLFWAHLFPSFLFPTALPRLSNHSPPSRHSSPSSPYLPLHLSSTAFSLSLNDVLAASPPRQFTQQWRLSSVRHATRQQRWVKLVGWFELRRCFISPVHRPLVRPPRRQAPFVSRPRLPQPEGTHGERPGERRERGRPHRRRRGDRRGVPC